MEIPAKLKHSCSFCGYTCNRPIDLESHMRKHTREKPFVCDKCNRRFSAQAEVVKHVKNLHHPRPPKVHTETFKCTLCPYQGHSKSSYERHVIDHTGERRYQCRQPNCKYAAKTSGELKQHIMKKHQNERKFNCKFPNCGYRAKFKGVLKSHYVTHSDYRPFACDFEGCNYQGKEKRNLQSHKLSVHHSGYKAFACSQCGFCTTNNRLLRQHGLTHTEEKPFKCDIIGCSYASKFKTSLKLHTEHRHTEKTFKCNFESCSFVGSSERSLEQHKKNVHSKKTYKCPCCHYRGAFLFRLRYHMERHSISQRTPCLNSSCTAHAKEREPVENNKKGYEEANHCPQEDNHSSSRSAVRYNMRLHDPFGQPVQCPLCPKQFCNNDLLSQHVQIHTAEKLFKCPLCQYESANKSTLIAHFRANHADVYPELREKSTCDHCHLNFGCAFGLALHTVKIKRAVVVLERLQLRFDL